MTRTEIIHSPNCHTPGPWDYDMDYIVAPDPDGRHPDIYIAEIAHSDEEGRIASPEQQDANRRLIAAAPELLQTCLWMMRELCEAWDEPEEKAIPERFRAAIAKATSHDCDWR